MHRKTRPTLSLRPLSLALLCLAGGFAGQAFAGQANLDGLASSQSHDRFIVKYRNGSAESRDAAALGRSLNRAASAVRVSDPSARGQSRAVGLRHLRRSALGSDVIATSHKLDRAAAETLMRRIAADPNVEYVEVDRLLRPMLTPNDPSYTKDQWHYKAPVSGSYGINLPTAWDLATGKGIVVAVLDTGGTTHADLKDTTVAGYDFVSDSYSGNDGNGRDSNPADPGDWRVEGGCTKDRRAWNYSASNSTWHGTHVAGTIAALTNNSTGVAGVAFGARVQHVRVLGRCGGYTSDIADGIVWASGGTVSGVPANPTPARVINMSLGGGGACDRTTQDAINGAVGRGATVVVAAGNSGVDASGSNPASCTNVVTVAASSRDGLRVIRQNWWSSSYGQVVDVAAPGMDIMSTMNSGTRSPGTESYKLSDGTSMATPHVAGVVALMQSARPSNSLLTPAQVEQLLKSSVTSFPSQPDKPIGAGIVNARSAVRAAIDY
jgi:serine protease